MWHVQSENLKTVVKERFHLLSLVGCYIEISMLNGMNSDGGWQPESKHK